MGYRIHANIPNVSTKFPEYLELGKQYDSKWDEFNDKWFSVGIDSGIIHPEDLENFYNEFIQVDIQEGEYEMYNLDIFYELIKYARDNNYAVYFLSF